MGVLGALFLLGIFTERANEWGALAGALSGTLVTVLLKTRTQVNGYIYATIGITVCFVVGYLVSLIVPGRKATEGLTIYTMAYRVEPEK